MRSERFQSGATGAISPMGITRGVRFVSMGNEGSNLDKRPYEPNWRQGVRGVVFEYGNRREEGGRRSERAKILVMMLSLKPQDVIEYLMQDDKKQDGK